MSLFRHPVGPESSRTYWRRRILFLLVLLAIIAVILLIVIRPGAGQAGPTTEPGTTTSGTPSSSPSPDPTDASGKAALACAAGDIVVEAITDHTSYSASQKPQLSLSVTNTGDKACTIQGGPADQVYTVTSGSETYWKSSDCQKNAQHTKVLISAGKTLTTGAVTWDRTRSDPATCDATSRPLVTAGGASYHLKAQIGGFASKGTAQFLLY